MTFGGTHGGVEEAQKALNVNKKKREAQGIYGGGDYHKVSQFATAF